MGYYNEIIRCPVTYMQLPNPNDKKKYGKEFIKNFLESTGNGRFLLTNQFANAILINGLDALKNMFGDEALDFDEKVIKPFLERYPSLIEMSVIKDNQLLFGSSFV